MPRRSRYFRILNYDGASFKHVFSDGTGVFHSDYMNGEQNCKRTKEQKSGGRFL